MTTTVPVDRMPGALAPARPIVPRPLWEANLLFKEPQFPECLALTEDEDAEGE